MNWIYLITCVLILAAIAVVDIKTRLIYDWMLIVGGIIILALNYFLRQPLDEVVLGGFVASGILLFLSLFSRQLVNVGDVKFGGLIGLMVWQYALQIIMVSFIIGAILSVYIRQRRQQITDTGMPFAPAMTLATLGGLIWRSVV